MKILCLLLLAVFLLAGCGELTSGEQKGEENGKESVVKQIGIPIGGISTGQSCSENISMSGFIPSGTQCRITSTIGFYRTLAACQNATGGHCNYCMARKTCPGTLYEIGVSNNPPTVCRANPGCP